MRKKYNFNGHVVFIWRMKMWLLLFFSFMTMIIYVMLLLIRMTVHRIFKLILLKFLLRPHSCTFVIISRDAWILNWVVLLSSSQQTHLSKQCSTKITNRTLFHAAGLLFHVRMPTHLEVCL